MKTPLLVSVDWDWFLPRSISDFDWAHNETNPLLHEEVWPHRRDNHPLTAGPDRNRTAFELLQIQGRKLKSFWKQRLRLDRLQAACIAESHKTIVDFILKHSPGGPVRLINYDAHHDWSYSLRCEDDELNCGNWGRWLWDRDRLECYHLVYPAWRRKHVESGKYHPFAELFYGRHPGQPLRPDYLFLCRSPAWMPTWLDEAWIQFIAPVLFHHSAEIESQPQAIQKRK